jgi:hypothetical protein
MLSVLLNWQLSHFQVTSILISWILYVQFVLPDAGSVIPLS